jgi:hypothetical protein
MKYVILEKARTLGARDLRKRRRRVVHWTGKEGKVLKVSDHIRYTVAGPESVREVKVKFDDGTTEWYELDKFTDKETKIPLYKMPKHEIEGRD